MSTILVPLDGSALAEQAIPYARLVARLLGARIDLLRVSTDLERENLLVDSLATMYVGEAATNYHDREREVLSELRAQAEGYLEQQAEKLRADGLEVIVTAMVGQPGQVIVEAAGDREVAMVVMATHGYSGVQRWALGSVADKIVHATPVPVMLVRGVAHPVEDPQIKEILVPLDGSKLSHQALPVAADLAYRAKADMLLLHAVDPLAEVYPGAPGLGRSMGHPDHVLREIVEESNAHLEQVAAEVGSGKTAVESISLVGYPAEVIVDEAERRDADLIVMATHGYSGLRRWALGSVADKVLHSTRTPVVLVRAKEQ